MERFIRDSGESERGVISVALRKRLGDKKLNEGFLTFRILLEKAGL